MKLFIMLLVFLGSMSLTYAEGTETDSAATLCGDDRTPKQIDGSQEEAQTNDSDKATKE